MGGLVPMPVNRTALVILGADPASQLRCPLHVGQRPIGVVGTAEDVGSLEGSIGTRPTGLAEEVRVPMVFKGR